MKPHVQKTQGASEPHPGDYRVVVYDAWISTKAAHPRGHLNLGLRVKADPGHSAQEGKKLTLLSTGLGMSQDSDETRKLMNGILKRQVYDGFGVKWPLKLQPLDPRIFVGKTAWVHLVWLKGVPQITRVSQQPPAQNPEIDPRKRSSAPLPKASEPPEQASCVDHDAEKDMIACIRRITDAAGLDNVPFLDDAVQILAHEQEQASRELRVLRANCREYHLCIQCVGTLDAASLAQGLERCKFCFEKDYDKFIKRHGPRLSQLPEPRPEVSSM